MIGSADLVFGVLSSRGWCGVTERRPWWMTAAAVYALGTLVATSSGDLFVQKARDVEVWLGFEVTGPLALATAPIHWAIFATFAWAFWTRRMWIVPWAAAYVFYAALSHFVWSVASVHGRGWMIGAAEAAAISAVGVLLLRAWRTAVAGACT